MAGMERAGDNGNDPRPLMGPLPHAAACEATLPMFTWSVSHFPYREGEFNKGHWQMWKCRG